MADISNEEFERLLDQAIENAQNFFVGKYKDEVAALSSLSKADIDAITPGDTTDLATYEKLMAVVREASRVNASQAQLAGRIKTLGEVAVQIAKKVPSLAAILA
jgi:predicted aminopeptidase